MLRLNIMLRFISIRSASLTVNTCSPDVIRVPPGSGSRAGFYPSGSKMVLEAFRQARPSALIHSWGSSIDLNRCKGMSPRRTNLIMSEGPRVITPDTVSDNATGHAHVRARGYSFFTLSWYHREEKGMKQPEKEVNKKIVFLEISAECWNRLGVHILLSCLT